MPAITATAPGKIILVGEHAVVYGRPAIAVPVNQVQARAVVMANPRASAGEIFLQAPDVGLESLLEDLPQGNPLAAAVNSVLAALGVSRPPACILRVSSTIPVASGLGSGAAVSVSIIRVLSRFLGRPLSDERVSALTFEIEKLHHGTPSGIDNTVITYGMPVFFVRGEPIETLIFPEPFTIVIGDTGIPSPTGVAVGDVRRLWEADHDSFESLFDEIACIVADARGFIEAGEPWKLGLLMDRNHELLTQMGVSSPELDYLVDAARSAGSLGAKLSGGGRGGNMIALVSQETRQVVAQALLDAGAKHVITTTVTPTRHRGLV
jgi:mevalonate kinase